MLVKLSHLESKEAKGKSLKGIEGKYGKQTKPRYDVLAVFDRYLPSASQKTVADRAEGAVEKLFFTFEQEEIKEVEHKGVSVRTEDEGMISKLRFEERMRFVFDDKDSLALKSLQEGVVDFADKRVEVGSAALRTSGKSDLLEVDLGELKSLKASQVLADEVRAGVPLEEGQQIVDAATVDA